METLYNDITSVFDLPIFYAKNVSMKFVGILKTFKFDYDTFIFMWSSFRCEWIKQEYN
jgi:hypothetical protein